MIECGSSCRLKLERVSRPASSNESMVAKIDAQQENVMSVKKKMSTGASVYDATVYIRASHLV